MKQNSPANRAPRRCGGECAVAAEQPDAAPLRPAEQQHAAIAERIAAWVSGETAGSASLIATCCRPQSIVQVTSRP